MRQKIIPDGVHQGIHDPLDSRLQAVPDQLESVATHVVVKAESQLIECIKEFTGKGSEPEGVQLGRVGVRGLWCRDCG